MADIERDKSFTNYRYFVITGEVVFMLLIGVISGFIMRISPYIDIAGIGMAIGVPILSMLKLKPKCKIEKSVWKPFAYSLLFLSVLKMFASSRLYMLSVKYIFIYCVVILFLSILIYLVIRVCTKKEKRNKEESEYHQKKCIKGMIIFDAGVLVLLTIYYLAAFTFMPAFDAMEKVPYDTLINVMNIVLVLGVLALSIIRIAVTRNGDKNFGTKTVIVLVFVTVGLLVFITMTLSSCTEKGDDVSAGYTVRIGTAEEGHSIFEEIGSGIISDSRAHFENTADSETARSFYVRELDFNDNFVIQFNFQRGKIENEHSVVKAPYGFVIGYADENNYTGIHFSEQETIELYKMKDGEYLTISTVEIVYAPVFISNYIEIMYIDNTLKILLNNEEVFENKTILCGSGFGCYIDTIDVQRHMDDLDKFFDKIAPYNKPPYFAVNDISIYNLDDAPKLEVPVITVKQPYILWNNHDGVNIAWETNKAVEAIFTYWNADGEKQTINCEKNKYSNVWIEDLTDRQTEYFYQIEAEGTLVGEGSFETEKAEGETIRVLFLSDNHVNPVFREVKEIVSQEDFDFIMHTGDVVDDGINVNEFNENFFRSSDNYLFSDTAVYTAIGNHDHHSSRRWFNVYFPYPDRTELSDGTMSQNFCLTYGDCAFLVLDLYTEQEETMDQLKWMEKQLEKDDVMEKQWKFVLIHEPPYGIDRGTWKLASEFSREELLPFMEEHNLEILISGHEHIYKVGQFGNVLSIVNGGAGGNGYGWTKPYQAVANLIGFTSYNYCIAEIDEEKVVWTCYGFNGEIMDSFIIQ